MKKGSIRTMAAVLSLSMALGLGAPAYTKDVQAATEHWNDASTESVAWQNWKTNWDAYSSNYENVSLTPGVNETQLNLAWYSKTAETPAVKIAKNADMADAKEYTGTQESAVVIGGTQYYSNKVTVTDLEENTQYYYQVMKNGDWTGTEEYSTKLFSGFSFLYVGDPQIGASKGQTSAENEKLNALNSVDTTAEQNLAARNDGYNWNKILNKAVKAHSDLSFMVSAGDQVNYAKNEREYAAYLGAEALASLPVATTIGNHDSSSNQYSLHYNNPNTFAADDTTYTEGKTAAGTDYYYTYGDVLFIVIDTNNYNCATHENVIKKAISENQDAKWRVVMFHQDIYGSGYDHSDSDGMVLRTQLTPIFDENKIDVVLQGHDHTYSRTFQLTGDGKEHPAFTSQRGENFKEENNCYIIKSDQASGTVVNPEGTVYLEANSATGSKFYNLITTQQDYIAERSQTWTPSYSVITVDENSFSMTAYDASTGRELGGSSTYTIVKDENAEKEDDAEAAKAAAEAAKAAAEEAQLALEKAKTAKAEAETQAAKAAEKSANAEVAKMAAEAAKTAAAEAQEKAEEAQAKAEAAKTAAEEAKAVATTEAEKAAAAQTATEAAKAATEAARVAAETAQAAAEAAQSAAEKAQAEAKAAAEAAKADKENAAKAEAAAKAEKEAAEAAKVAAEAAKAAAEAAAETAQAAAEKTVKATATPKKATLSKVTSTKKKQVKVTWKKDTKASGYQVVCATNKSFTKNVKKISVTKKTQTSLKINKLTSKKKVYVKVRSYKKVDGKKLYGKYSAVKSVKVK